MIPELGFRLDPGGWRIEHVAPLLRMKVSALQYVIRGDDNEGLDIQGDVLTVSDDYGQRFIYRVRDYDPHQPGAWVLLERPD